METSLDKRSTREHNGGMTATAFTTSQGARGSTATERHYAVVRRDTAAVLYRTDDIGRARKRQADSSPYSPTRHSTSCGADVVDALTGEVL